MYQKKKNGNKKSEIISQKEIICQNRKGKILSYGNYFIHRTNTRNLRSQGRRLDLFRWACKKMRNVYRPSTGPNLRKQMDRKTADGTSLTLIRTRGTKTFTMMYPRLEVLPSISYTPHLTGRLQQLAVSRRLIHPLIECRAGPRWARPLNLVIASVNFTLVSSQCIYKFRNSHLFNAYRSGLW